MISSCASTAKNFSSCISRGFRIYDKQDSSPRKHGGCIVELQEASQFYEKKPQVIVFGEWPASRDWDMTRSAYLAALAILIAVSLLVCSASLAADSTQTSGRWKITSAKICRTSGGVVISTIEVIGNYPVYSFFIPRPVWTVNGNVVEASPVYAQGRLIAFQLLNASPYLDHGKKNTVKFALPDHNGSRVFLYDHSRIPDGQCYEFF